MHGTLESFSTTMKMQAGWQGMHLKRSKNMNGWRDAKKSYPSTRAIEFGPTKKGSIIFKEKVEDDGPDQKEIWNTKCNHDEGRRLRET